MFSSGPFKIGAQILEGIIKVSQKILNFFLLRNLSINFFIINTIPCYHQKGNIFYLIGINMYMLAYETVTFLKLI